MTDFFDKTLLPTRQLTINEVKRERIIEQIAAAYKGQKFKGQAIEDNTLFARLFLGAAIKGKLLTFTEKGWQDAEWERLPNVSEDTDEELLKKRLRVLGYDMDLAERIARGRVSTSEEAKAKKQVREILTNENIGKIDGRTKSSQKIGALLSGEEQKLFDRFKKDVYAEFPTLKGNPIDELGTNELALQYVCIQRALGKIATSSATTKNLDDLGKMMESYQKQCKSLGISREQREASRKKDDAGSLADFARTYQERIQDGTYFDVIKTGLIEEFHMLINKYKRDELPAWMVQYYYAGYIEFPTGMVRAIDIPWLLEIAVSEGIVDG